MPSHHSTTALALGLVALLSSAGCQATPTGTLPFEAPATPVEQVRLLTGDAVLDAADPVAQDATVYLVPPVAGQEWVLPTTYARGVEEVVDWSGTGAGSATLLNTHGQQVYRVEEGGAATRAVIPAGQYRLVISGVAPAALGTAPQLTLEVSRLQKQYASELFAAQREHRDLIDACCP